MSFKFKSSEIALFTNLNLLPYHIYLENSIVLYILIVSFSSITSIKGIEAVASGSTANNISSCTQPPVNASPPIYLLVKSTQYEDSSPSNKDPSLFYVISHKSHKSISLFK